MTPRDLGTELAARQIAATTDTLVRLIDPALLTDLSDTVDS